MDAELATFLAQHTPFAEEMAVWGNESIDLRITSYLSQAIPPLAFVTSVRGIVLQGDSVLVVRDVWSAHILPGGRREAGETLLDTLKREVLEETGWTLSTIKLLGFKHLQHLTPRPDNYSYPYPDFFHVIYIAYAEQFQPESMFSAAVLEAEYVLDAKFQPIASVRPPMITESDLLYLEAAQTNI